MSRRDPRTVACLRALLPALVLALPVPGAVGRGLGPRDAAAALQDLHDPSRTAPVTFVALDVLLDPRGLELAAWQAELRFDPRHVRLVGVEGGEDPRFADPPAYDPAALRGHSVRLAAFHTAADGPRSRTRVARLHLAVRDDAALSCLTNTEVRLLACASTHGRLDGGRLTLEPSR